jgi:benzoyl-CoA reductase/2-hydroxyglutaryl-CoA dehydratase subunit BcrC/BadD/HgdB
MLIIGSPIYYPAYKVPQLMEEIGIDLCGCFEPAELHAQIERHRPNGILWHILKGQISYDFELLRMEDYITDELKIPVFRLETDYQDQDVEQLRVRMEAFAELLQGRAK